MNCTICGEPVVLTPSAKERADRFGGTPESYTKLFPHHAKCFLRKRSKEARDLMRRVNSGAHC